MRHIFFLLFTLFFVSDAYAADKPNYQEVTIAASASESSVFDISTITPGAGSLLGLFMPSAWTTANLTLMVSPTCAAPWYNAYDDAGTEYTIGGGASRYVGLDPAYFVGIRCAKLRSGTVSVPVTQASTRVIKIGFGRF